MASSYATLLSISQPRGYHSVKSNKELTATKVSVGTVSNYNRCCDSTVLTTQASLLMLPITTTQIHPSHISIPSKQIRLQVRITKCRQTRWTSQHNEGIHEQ